MTLLKLIKPKEIPKHQQMCVGEGVISLEDGCIPLDNICLMDITLQKGISNLSGSVLFVMGIILMFILNGIFRAIGGYCIFFGILFMIMAWIINKMRKYSLIITVNSGAKIIFQSSNIKYMRNLLRNIQEAINNRQIQFVANVKNDYISFDIENVKTYYGCLVKKENNVDIKGDRNFVNIGKIREIGDVIWGDDAEINKKVSKDKTTNIQVLSDEQWDTLVKFFATRAKVLGKESEAYKPCVQMYYAAKTKNASTLKKVMTSVKDTFLKTIIGEGVSSAVHALLSLFVKI